MIDTRFWLMSKVQLQFLADCKIDRDELVSVSFSNTNGQCLLTPTGFIRLGREFGIAKVMLSRLVPDQPRFLANNVEFVCVCSEDELNRVAAEFKLEWAHSHLMEAIATQKVRCYNSRR